MSDDLALRGCRVLAAAILKQAWADATSTRIRGVGNTDSNLPTATEMHEARGWLIENAAEWLEIAGLEVEIPRGEMERWRDEFRRCYQPELVQE